MRKNVLFIIGDFWPTRTGGTIRIEKLIKYLPDLNWKGVVLSKKLESMNNHEVIDSTPIYRTNAYNIGLLYQKIKGWFKVKKSATRSAMAGSGSQNANGRLADYFFVPDVDVFWAIGSLRKISQIIKKEKIEIIYSSSPFASVHIAALLYRKYVNKSIKWVVEFRDPWTFNPFRNKKMNFFEKIDHKLESLVLRSCDYIIVTSDAYRQEFMNKYPLLSPDKIKFIPNGYDSEDFMQLKPKVIKAGEKIKIVHAGNFYGKRSIKPFLEALYLIYQKNPALVNEVSFTQFGIIDPEGEAFNLENPNPLFELKKAIPHKDSLQEIVDADWLLLVPGPGAGTMPGKLYEYLATGNPIIGLVDEGPAKELVLKLEIGYIASPNDIEAIFNLLLEITERRSRYGSMNNNSPELKRFDRKNIAREVSLLLDSCLIE